VTKKARGTKRKAQNSNVKLKIFALLVIFFSFSFLVFSLFKDLPSPTKLKSAPYPVSTKIFDRNSKLLYEIYAEQKRTPIKLEDVPEHLIQATIAIEDKDFYKHRGFSYRGIFRALFNIIFHRRLQGGSTITQQLVKTALLTPERTLKRKIREAVLSLAVETLYSKDEILEMYLNQVPYGGEAWGIQAASEKYFGEKVSDLTLAEAALLAGLPRAPTKYSPFGSHPEFAKARQKQVLVRMAEDSYITKEEKREAEKQDLALAPQTTNIKAPHFVMYIKEILVEKYGQKLVEQGGLRVTTTLDLEIQDFSQETVASEIVKLKSSKISNGGALVTKPKTGEILAMVGSKDYFAEDIDGKVNVTLASRQPGSAIKPINYALGFLNGYSPATLFLDIPTCFSVPGQPLYCPQNFDNSFRGPIQVRFALGNSVNMAAVKMLYLNGVEAMVELARKMGIESFQDPTRYGLSLTLGGGEVKMTEMATAFGVFANSGIRVDLNPILKVEDYQGKVLEEFEPEEESRILPMEVTYLISHILLDNNARAGVFGTSSYLVIPNHAVSVKTGTTNDRRDNWTVGYTPSHLIAVWSGNNDNSPTWTFGATGAAPIWNKITRFVLEDEPDEWPSKPENIVGRQVCTSSGQFPEESETPGGEETCQTRFEYFIKDSPSSEAEFLKTAVEVDKTTGQLASEETPPENREMQEHQIVKDVLGTIYCLDCPLPEKPVLIKYPG
jgi:1A family penicillin-binding protein